jgi:hypothetical protein
MGDEEIVVKDRVLGLVVAMTLAAVMVPGVALAANADTAICKDGRWKGLERANGSRFDNQGACVNYVAKGGTLGARGPLIIAYTNLDGVPGFGPGDQLIAKWVDANGSGDPDAGDRVEMGKYPTTFTPNGPGDFANFGVTSHAIGSDPDFEPPGEDYRRVLADVGDYYLDFIALGGDERYAEEGWVPTCGEAGTAGLQIIDGLDSRVPTNLLQASVCSVSQPSVEVTHWQDGIDDGDSMLIDVDFFFE